MSKPKLVAYIALAIITFAGAELQAGALFRAEPDQVKDLLDATKIREATQAEVDQHEADQKAAEAAAANAAKANKKVEARVLVDCAHGRAGEPVALDPDVAKTAEREGLVDTNAAAVKYAKAEAAAKAKAKAEA